MKSVEIPSGSLVKVVQLDQVEALTESGWSVVGTVEQDITAPLTEEAVRPPDLSGYDNHEGFISLTKWAVLKGTFFVLTRDPHALITQLRADLDAANTKIGEQERSLQKSSLENKSLQSQLTDIKDQCKRLEDSHNTSVGLRFTAEDQTAQLRREKLLFEKALGTLGVEQILKGEKFTGQVDVLSEERVGLLVPDRFDRVGSES